MDDCVACELGLVHGAEKLSTKISRWSGHGSTIAFDYQTLEAASVVTGVVHAQGVDKPSDVPKTVISDVNILYHQPGIPAALNPHCETDSSTCVDTAGKIVYVVFDEPVILASLQFNDVLRSHRTAIDELTHAAAEIVLG